MTELFNTLVEKFEEIPLWVNAITALVTGASAITMLTATRKDNIIADKILMVLNFLALNVFKNKNADAVDPVVAEKEEPTN